MALLDKKALGSWKMNFDLHVLTIMRQEGCTKAVAMAQAYHEGQEGYAKLRARVAPAPLLETDKSK